MVAQRVFQLDGSGSIPTHPQQLIIGEGKFSDFSDLLDEYHYKGSNIGGNIHYNLKLAYNGRIFGGAVLGAMRHEDNYSTNSIEIRRMVLHPECPKYTASYFLSKIIWWLHKNTNINIVYTFADTTVNHVGTCYKAANFKKVKETNKSKYVLWNNKRYHIRSLSIDRPYSYELRNAIKNGQAEIITGKHKILYSYNISRTNNIKVYKQKRFRI